MDECGVCPAAVHAALGVWAGPRLGDEVGEDALEALRGPCVESAEREIEADQNCFPARNKLRLLRIVETFCEERTTERMGISIVAMEVIDRVLYAVLGGPRRPRVSLGVLADPIKSPIVTCQRELLHLLQHFSDQERPEVP